MKIVLTGGTGFLGRHLVSYLSALRHEIILIQRSDIREGIYRISKLIKSSDVLINLAGSPVIKRWTASNKSEMISSRLTTTKMLVDLIADMSPEERPSVFLSASAIGIYDSINFHSESSENYDDNFLADVCKKWENALVPLKQTNTRLCVLRIGIVLGKDGGMLKQLIPLFKLGLGGKIGSGLQHFSFIHYQDFCTVVNYLIENENCKGVFNLTAPEISTNKEFTRILSEEIHRPAFFTVPEIALKLFYGNAAVTMIRGQKVYPEHLLHCGFQFRYPDLTSAIRSIVK